MIIDLLRRGAFTSMILVELPVLGKHAIPGGIFQVINTDITYASLRLALCLLAC